MHMDSSSPHLKDNDNLEEENAEDIGSTPPATASGKNKRKNVGSRSTKTKATSTRSSVWKHFTRIEEDYDTCLCNYCGKSFTCPTSSGTSSLKKHLTLCKEHLVWVESKKERPNVITPEVEGDLQMSKVSDSVVREASNELIVMVELPLAFIECMAWKYFCSRVNLPKQKSRRTTTRDIVALYVKKKSAMMKVFGANKQRVSLTTDIWKALTTGASYMVITAHFIDAMWNLKKLIIGFKNIDDHKGSTISAVLLECLAEWGIKKVFTITVDNATSNDSALRRFKEAFSSVGSDALILGGELLHVRCVAHIINLVVKDGLQEVDTSISAIRNGIEYVRGSTNRIKAFDLRVESTKMTRGSLPLDCKTRWNSTYLMLISALKFRSGFDKMAKEDMLYTAFFLDKSGGKQRIGPATKNDWDEVARLVRFLTIFYNSTLVVSASSSVNSYKCYSEIVTIERNLIKLSNDPDATLRTKAASMREKFDKYWDGLKGINRVVIIASILDPCNNMRFATLCFERLYGKDSVESKELTTSVTYAMKKLFDEYNINVATTETSSRSAASDSRSGQESQDHATGSVFFNMDLDFEGGYERMDFVYDEMVDELGNDDASFELDTYLKEACEVRKKNMFGTEFDVLGWWKLNSSKFPVLSEMARDVLAMQVSSVASESAFSTSGRILDPYRSCLTHYMIEVLMCTEQWLKCEVRLNERGII